MDGAAPAADGGTMLGGPLPGVPGAGPGGGDGEHGGGHREGQQEPGPAEEGAPGPVADGVRFTPCAVRS